MSDAEIRSINALRAAKKDDNSLLTPAECLEDAAQDIRSGETVADKAMAILLNTGEDGAFYDIRWYASNMRSSEMLALLEATKIRILTAMSFIQEPQ